MKTIKNSKHPLLGYSLLAVCMVALMGCIELYLGRKLFCPCGIRLWWGNINNYGNAQMLFDWYSFVHVLHGFVYYGLISIFDRNKKLSVIQKFIIAIALSCSFEIAENTKWIIAAYRSHYSSFHYTGDSVLNSTGDVISVAIGFLIASKAKLKISIPLLALDIFLIIFSIHTVITSNSIIILDKIQHFRL